ncbi:MAG: DEAD/DEAH box helicase [Bacillota bacterium]|nr:DEAD/DEAH box helicase [Bacillota bacterium]
MAEAGPRRPVIVQSDRSILLEVDNPAFEEARDFLLRFAELEKSPEHVHTYRITPISLWNAAAAGLEPGDVVSGLASLSRYPVPDNIRREAVEYMGRYGRLRLVSREGMLVLESDDPILLTQLWHTESVRRHLAGSPAETYLMVRDGHRGHVKQAVIRQGYPVEDLAGYVRGQPLSVRLRSTATAAGRPFQLRDYQREAVDTFWAGGGPAGGSGVIVLPCGAGKTVIGLAAMARLGVQTLILGTNIVALRQWRDEILDKTNLTADQIGEYSGEAKEIRPVTLATYQILCHRQSREGEFPHFGVFTARDWGLIIYDEVHLLPAPVFRITAEIQARRRLGLTATLVREDGLETDVFTLIGPKKYDVPWKVLERQGWIAEAECFEVRLDLPPGARLDYAVASEREKFRVASENPGKLDLLGALVAAHRADRVLVMGQYLDQLHEAARVLGAPLITGRTPNLERERLYDDFRAGRVRLLVVSKVANFAVDLPEANVAVQISGTFGSRQEEAQRLGRVLRPKADGRPARFYSLVTRESKDQWFAAKRQLFLTEQGYDYRILDAADLPGVLAAAAESSGRVASAPPTVAAGAHGADQGASNGSANGSNNGGKAGRGP